MSKYEMCAGNTALFIRDTDGDWHKVENVEFTRHRYDWTSDVSEFTFEVSGNPLSGPMALPSADSKRQKYISHLPKKVIVSGPCVICIWKDGTKTISRCHDGDEMDVRTGVLLNAIKKWMPGGTYWQDVMEDVTVEDQNEKRPGASFKRPDGLETVGHATIEHRPCRPYMRGGKYGDDEKVMVIEAVEGGMSQAGASRKFGISQGTVSKWMSEWRGKNGND